MTNKTQAPHYFDQLIGLGLPDDRPAILERIYKFMTADGPGWAIFTFSHHDEAVENQVDITVESGETADWHAQLVLDLAALEQLGYNKLVKFQC